MCFINLQSLAIVYLKLMLVVCISFGALLYDGVLFQLLH
jgi:hypothetical protein